MDLASWTDALRGAFDRATEHKSAATISAVAGGVVVLSGVYFLLSSRRNRRSRSRPYATELSGGGIQREKVHKAFVDYSNSYGKEAGAGIVEKSETSKLVDTFYNLVTDFYEWGWGESFHFSIRLPGKTEQASEAANESRIATLCKLRPGKKCLDCGCGVGGPMRTVAAFSGAEVTGVTINQYQVDRCNSHNRRYGLESLCRAVQGSFLNLEFVASSFDAAYAIEATCHAPDVAVAYGEIFRVLKPGGIFVSYEWVATPLFDATNPSHVKAMDDVIYGNGLPDMRTAKECIDAARSVGFALLEERDLALDHNVCKPWYTRIEQIRLRAVSINRGFVNLLSALHLLPTGMKQVHDMLLDHAAKGLVKTGHDGTFTPMHLLVFQKPAA